MRNVVVAAEGLGKQYRLGETRQTYRTLRESVSALLRRRPEQGVERIWALRGVDFEIERGEAVGIIGPNGAGKTTLLRILARITQPTEGCARIRGRVGSLLDVGAGFHLELTGRENVYLSGAILGMRRREIERRLDEIVSFAEVEQFLDTPLKRYSTGMYVRLAFAVAAHLEADVMLVDEVLSVGDLAFQEKCLGKMQSQMAGEGRTVLFVSHNLGSVKALTERCLWLDHGSIRMAGRTEDVFREYVGSHSAREAGEADLSNLAAGRPAGKHLLQEVTFEAVRLRRPDGRPSAIHVEGEPITVAVELRCRVQRFERPLEILCQVRTIEGVGVFTSTTGLRPARLRQGLHRASVTFDPNFLTAGTYELTLYILSGLAQDLLTPAIRFRVEADPTVADVPQSRLGGVVRTSYEWEELSAVEDTPAVAAGG
jgi:lipopolysaccharide transport system ATP-binding protein